MKNYKEQAKRLRSHLEVAGIAKIQHNQALHAIAAIHGCRNWQTLNAKTGTSIKEPGEAPLMLWEVMHHHCHGVDCHLLAAAQCPSQEQAIAALPEMDFEDGREDEWLDIEQASVPENYIQWLQGQKPAPVTPASTQTILRQKLNAGLNLTEQQSDHTTVYAILPDGTKIPGETTVIWPDQTTLNDEGEEIAVELHLKATAEGVIQDVWPKDSRPEESFGTSSQTADEIVDDLKAKNSGIQTARFVGASTVLDGSELGEQFYQNCPFSFGDNNRSLIDKDDFINALNDFVDDDNEETFNKIQKMVNTLPRGTYIDLES